MKVFIAKGLLGGSKALVDGLTEAGYEVEVYTLKRNLLKAVEQESSWAIIGLNGGCATAISVTNIMKGRGNAPDVALMLDPNVQTSLRDVLGLTIVSDRDNAVFIDGLRKFKQVRCTKAKLASHPDVHWRIVNFLSKHSGKQERRYLTSK